MNLQQLELQILELHTGLTLRPTLETAARLGELLGQAKAQLPHGKWLSWLRRIRLAPRNAQIYIQVNANLDSYLSARQTVTIKEFLAVLRMATRASRRKQFQQTGSPVMPEPGKPGMARQGIPLSFLDLFAGIGGFALATRLADLKFQHHLFSEIEANACKIYKKNFPQAVGLGDIREIKGQEIKHKHPGDWLVTGGFPCQDISEAGKRRGLNAHRSSLWWEMWRVIGELRPRYAIIENVPPLCGKGLDRVLCGFAEIGYDAEWEILSAGEAGAPHKRERIWIVAYPHSDGCRDRPDSRDQDKTDVGGGIKFDRGHQSNPPWIDWPSVTATGALHSQPIICRMDHGLSPWLDRIRGLGNAIVPQVAAAILLRLKIWQDA
jgi:DNA (cytosine-5)-methyltransferase 1